MAEKPRKPGKELNLNNIDDRLKLTLFHSVDKRLFKQFLSMFVNFVGIETIYYCKSNNRQCIECHASNYGLVKCGKRERRKIIYLNYKRFLED